MFLPRDVITLSITPTIDTGIYAAGDVLFASNKLISATMNTGAASRLANVIVLDSDNEKAAIDLLFFDQDPGSVGSINAALNLSAAQLAMLVGIQNIATGDYTTLKAATNAIGIKSTNLMLQSKKAFKDLWVVGVAQGTPTYTTAADLSFKFVLERQG